MISKDSRVALCGEIEPIELRDATFVETPLLLNFHDLLLRSQTQLERAQKRVLGAPYTTLHTKDLFDKLREVPLPFERNNVDLIDSISTLVNGEINYDEGVNNFVFRRNNESIPIQNTASGIKVFGILKLLLANSFVDENTALIFDEPENHLHPTWQLKLAEILVELVANGVYVIVSSHSPYMIEALERYSKRKGLESKSSFYFADNRIIEDKSQLEAIFALLAQPFDKFREMDAEVLHNE